MPIKHTEALAEIALIEFREFFDDESGYEDADGEKLHTASFIKESSLIRNLKYKFEKYFEERIYPLGEE